MKEITKKTLVPIELGDMVLKEFEKLMDKGTPVREAVKRGAEEAIIKWRDTRVYKSGG